MAEQISSRTYSLLNRLPHPVLRGMKLHYRHIRFLRARELGRKNYRAFGHLYGHKVLFVAGLPKSGTTWVESMLQAYPGYTIIPDPRITEWEYVHGGSHSYELSENYFEKIRGTLALVKVHSHGSKNNVRILKDLEIPYLVIYRDLRDAAVSHYFYVRRTKWHPEYPVYSALGVEEGLCHFANTLLPEWRDWVMGWKENRDGTMSRVLQYERLVAEPLQEFKDVLRLFALPEDRAEGIIQDHDFAKLKQRGSFFRKGSPGDWKVHFNGRASDLFKDRIGAFLIDEGYERDTNW